MVTDWVRRWLEEGTETAARRLLKVYESAGVSSRASIVPIEEVFAGHDFEHQNEVYRQAARDAATGLASRALASAGLRPADVSLLVSVSCTGFMIPAVDAFVADRLGMGPRLARLPITESGCAGGVVGLARACDYLAAHPEQAALLLTVEFSSLTFQRWDRSATPHRPSSRRGPASQSLAFRGRLRRERFIGADAVLALAGPPVGTAAEGDQHLHPLQESGQSLALPGPGANRALGFAVVGISHHASSALA